MTTLLGISLLLAAGVAFSETPPPRLHVSMISLGVRDMDRSVKFYRETLGLPMLGQPGVVTQFQAGDVIIALNGPLGRAAGDAMVGAVEIVFPVQSVAKVHTDLARRGCVFLNEPREIFPGTWGATFADPDGHRLTILGPQ
ncbi:MAG TPA: VOC family protein [Bryobacteraceae bacterium]